MAKFKLYTYNNITFRAFNKEHARRKIFKKLKVKVAFSDLAKAIKRVKVC